MGRSLRLFSRYKTIGTNKNCVPTSIHPELKFQREFIEQAAILGKVCLLGSENAVFVFTSK